MEGRSIVRFLRTRREATVLAMLVIVFLGLTFASEFFLTGRNLSNVARQISVVGIVALGQALVIIAGGIDRSVGSVIGLAAVTAAMVSAATGMPSLGIVGAIAIGMAVGFLNGVLVTRIRINPFITTLGTLSIARGAALLATNGNPQRFDNWAAWLGYGRIGEVPVQFLLLVALTLVVAFFATRTRWGRNVYAVGDNARAARLAGIDVARTRIMVFTLSGSLAGRGGLVLGGMLTNSNPNLGLGYELDVIAAVILGGVALSGGRERQEAAAVEQDLHVGLLPRVQRVQSTTRSVGQRPAAVPSPVSRPPAAGSGCPHRPPGSRRGRW